MINKLIPGLLIIFLPTFTSADELLSDLSFHRGYAVISPQKDIYTDRSEIEAIHTLSANENKDPPQPEWRLVQWGSQQSLANTSATHPENSDIRWEVQISRDNNPALYKSVTLNHTGELTLELNALNEFEGRYLKNLDAYWPHLLMAQNISSKKLDQYKKIELSLDARLLFDHKNLSEAYQTGIHAARYPVAIAVRNTLSGNMFWLSLVLYDDRYPKVGFSCTKCTIGSNGEETCRTPVKIDEPGRWECPFDGNRWSKETEKKGTRKMIFRLPTEAYTQDNIHLGEWSNYKIDLLPYLEAAIQAASETKAVRGFSRDLRFYQLSFFSMGWEITGLNHAAITVKNLSLTGL